MITYEERLSSWNLYKELTFLNVRIVVNSRNSATDMVFDAAAASDESWLFKRKETPVPVSSDGAANHRIEAAVPLDNTWEYGGTVLWQCVGVLGFVLLQAPWYFIRWLCSLLQLPAVLWAGHKPTDTDIVDLIEGTGLCMLLSKVQAGVSDLFKFEFSHCNLVLAGKQLKSMSIIYQKAVAPDSSTGR